MHKYFVIFDTNVIVSGLYDDDPTSYPVRLLDYIYKDIIIPVYSEEIINEYRDVLSREEFHLTKSIVGKMINLIRSLGIMIDPDKLDINFRDYDDLKFYEVLMTKDKYNKKLVTGNIKHFPVQKNILTPKEMIDIIENKKKT